MSILNTQFNSLRAIYDFFRLSSCFRPVTRLLSTNINIFLVSINCFSYTHKYRWAFKPCISKCKKIVCASVLPLHYNWTLAKYLTIKHLKFVKTEKRQVCLYYWLNMKWLRVYWISILMNGFGFNKNCKWVLCVAILLLLWKMGGGDFIERRKWG